MGKDKDWFSHPAVIFWRGIEVEQIKKIINKYILSEPILDLGCAEGTIGEMIFKGKGIVGIDNDVASLKRNNYRDGTYAKLVLGDVRKMAFENNAFGTVFSNSVIEHIPQLNKVLNEINRVLKNNGKFIFTVPSHKFPEYLLFSWIKGYGYLRNKWLNHYHCYSHLEWIKLLKEYNLNVVEYHYYLSKKETKWWDLMCWIMFILRFKFIGDLLRKIHCRKNNDYYGAGLLIISEKIT